MSGVADVSIHTGGDDPKQVSRTIGPGAKINTINSGIEIGAGQGTSGALDDGKDDAIDERKSIVEFIVEEINSSYPRVWESAKDRHPVGPIRI